MQGEAGMIEALKARVNGDETLVRRGRFLSTTFLLEVGQTAWLISIFEGKVVSVASGPFVMPSWSFALRAPEAEWQKFWGQGRRQSADFHGQPSLLQGSAGE